MNAVAHTCHAHGCTKRVPPKMFMCREHWFKLRKPMRDAIWREYRPGQEKDKQPSIAYLAVQQRAIGEVAFKPNDEAAAATAAPYLVKAHMLRSMLLAAKQRDPLEGIVPSRSDPIARQFDVPRTAQASPKDGGLK